MIVQSLIERQPMASSFHDRHMKGKSATISPIVEPTKKTSEHIDALNQQKSQALCELRWLQFLLSVWGCPHWTTLIVGESRWTFTNIEENSDLLQNNHQYDVTGPIRPQNGKSWTLKWL